MAHSGRPNHNYNFRNTESRQVQYNHQLQSVYSSTPFVAPNVQKHPYAISGRTVAPTADTVSPISMETPFRPLDSVRDTAQSNQDRTPGINLSGSANSSILSSASSEFNPADFYTSDYAISVAAEHAEDMPSRIRRARYNYLANQFDNQADRPDITYRTRGYDAHNLSAMDASPLQGPTANVSAERTLLDQSQSIPVHLLTENLEQSRNSCHGRSMPHVRPAQSSDFPCMAPRRTFHSLNQGHSKQGDKVRSAQSVAAEETTWQNDKNRPGNGPNNLLFDTSIPPPVMSIASVTPPIRSIPYIAPPIQSVASGLPPFTYMLPDEIITSVPTVPSNVLSEAYVSEPITEFPVKKPFPSISDCIVANRGNKSKAAPTSVISSSAVPEPLEAVTSVTFTPFIPRVASNLYTLGSNPGTGNSMSTYDDARLSGNTLTQQAAVQGPNNSHASSITTSAVTFQSVNRGFNPLTGFGYDQMSQVSGGLNIPYTLTQTTGTVTTTDRQATTQTMTSTTSMDNDRFDWDIMRDMMKTMIDSAKQDILSQVQTNDCSSKTPVSLHVTYSDPLVSNDEPASSGVPVSRVDVQNLSRLRYSKDSAKGSTSSAQESYSSSTYTDYTDTDNSEYDRHKSRRHRHKTMSSHKHSTTSKTLSEHDISVLVRQGVDEKTLRRKAEQSFNSTKVSDLPAIPLTQYIVPLSADSIQKFSGNMEDWESWKESFLSYARSIPVAQRLFTFRIKLDSNSQDVIAGCLGSDEKAFEEAVEMIDKSMNKPDLVVNILISKIQDVLNERARHDDAYFMSMVSKVRRFTTQILSVDAFQLAALNGLTTRFSQVIPDRPYNKVSNLMGKYINNVSRYNFKNVLAICEKHVEWLRNQSANRRATGRSRRGNFPDHHSYDKDRRQRYGQGKGQAQVTSVTESEPVGDYTSDDNDIESDVVAQARLDSMPINSYKPSADIQGFKDQRGRSQEKKTTGLKGRQVRSSSLSFKSPGRSRSKSKQRKNVCTLCSKEGHIPRDCTQPPSLMLDLVDSNRLCRVCLFPGHYGAECPIYLCCIDDPQTCRASDCYKGPHCLKLCSELKQSRK